ncbi:MAG: class F sortase [Hamadaea sp.]|nr:class F sortase [Hamadaea sp.]NUR52388.1 class F sortase [Hamadaea sp.]NUT06344.1 class F sortase [Hamadaea sp.]
MPPTRTHHRADRRGTMFRVGWWLACLALMAAGGWGIGQLATAAHKPGTPPPLPAQVLALPSGGLAQPPTGPGALTRSVPRKIIIPKIGLRAWIEQIGLRPDGAIATPSYERANHASWYKLGPTPGEAGAAVIIGHVDTKKSVGVFYYLTRLRPGDEVEVEREDRTTAVFTIEMMESFPKAAFPADRVYAGGSTPELRLITCGGRYNAKTHSYSDNIVVFARLTGVRRPPPPQV